MRNTKFSHLSAITTGLEAVAAILSAVKVIAFSIRSLASVSQENTANAEPRKGSGLGVHKWILLAGVFVGAITIAYLETIVANSKPKKSVQPEQHEKIETIYVTR